MRLIDVDVLLSDRMKTKFYHLPNGDVAIPLIDVEHAPTVGGWISVKDKLPDKNGDYLVVTSFFDRRRIEVLTFVQNLEKLDLYDFHGKRRPGFVDYNSEYGFSERRVSLWMPLPEIPKEDNDEAN